MTAVAKCGNCRWYVNTGDKGPCKRYAPRHCRDGHPEYAIWPWVHYGDVCGEHEPDRARIFSHEGN